MTPTEVRLALLRHGYVPIPCAGKAPTLKGWQNHTQTNPNEINLWGKLYAIATNTGSLTKYTPAIDIDITLLPAAEAVEALAREEFEERGYVLVRVGLPPKRAILLRTDEPFEKLTCAFTAPDGGTHKVEILCDGQQVVVDRVHPDSGRPYVWHGGSPLTTARADLPYARRDDVIAFLDKAAQLLAEEFGFQLTGESKSKTANGHDDSAEAADIAHLVDNILHGRELHDSLRDYAMSLIGSGASKRETIATLRGLMDAAHVPHDARWQARRDDIPRMVAGAEKRHRDSIRAQAQAQATGDGVRLEDFRAYMPQHTYVFLPTREIWLAKSVNGRLPPVEIGGGRVSPSLWLDINAPVEQMTWAPGEPMLITDRLISEGGWIERAGCTVLNLYRPPTIVPGDAAQAGPWLDHVHRIYPDDAEHLINWLAQRVQRPHEKINHANVLGGAQGIGKDTLLEPVKRAVGPWNVAEVSPHHLIGRFNGFLKSVIMRVSEARDLGEINRYSLYDHMKSITAAPPDVLRVDEKNVREYSILNCTGVILTTNHKTDGIFLPADDRRHYVAWSDAVREDFTEDYWTRLWNWYDQGGDAHVAALLATRDITGFNPKAPPPKTPAFWDIVDANRAPEDAELADVLDLLSNPDVVTLARVQGSASGDFADWIKDRKNRRIIPHRFEQCGYAPVRNPSARDGLWVLNGARQVIYAKTGLCLRDQIAAARRLVDGR